MGGESMAKGNAAALMCPRMKNPLKITNQRNNYQEEEDISVDEAPSLSSYNHQIRPLIDRLRHLKIIQLPTIVVVGDQSSGKSSVLESIAGISLPRGTRVPLIMRLQNHPYPSPELFLEFNEKIVPTDEQDIADAISSATEEIAGTGKGISSNPLTLVVKKKGVPDLTMVDLPGITRVPVRGQPEDIYEQISNIIMDFITPEESIILNVLSASVDFSTCESIRMSKKVDKKGQRTLAVVTKADKAPEGLLEKVTADDVSIGLGYVCVRNRIGDESYQEARVEEAKLFENHPHLSKINKSIVGIPVLAERLVKIQALIIAKCLPEIVRKLNEKLSDDLRELPKRTTSTSTSTSVDDDDEAMTTCMYIFGSAKESLRKILLQGSGGGFDEYPDTVKMYGTGARLAEMLDKFSEELEHEESEKFLVEEIKVLEETREIGLPNFVSRTSFLTLLQKKVKVKVKGISAIHLDFVEKIWSYVQVVIVSVFLRHYEEELVSCTTRGVENLIARKVQQSVDWVNYMVEMEKLTAYTCNLEYMSSWKKLMCRQDEFMRTVNKNTCNRVITIDEFGDINVDHLYELRDNWLLWDAFDLKMRMTAYWRIVVRRMVDNMALHVRYSIHNLVNKEMEMEIINELVRMYY